MDFIYEFKRIELKEQALTHSSFFHENREISLGDNERFEFLGDAVLDLALGAKLMVLFPHISEGDLSKLRASLVNEVTLAELAEEINLSLFIKLGRGELVTQGEKKPRILASALEALIGAIFLDGGFDRASLVIDRLFESRLKEVEPSEAFCEDSKTRLQEIVQQKYSVTPVYEVVNVEGPAHQRTFEVQLLINGEIKARGSGSSKKRATQMAASKALEFLK